MKRVQAIFANSSSIARLKPNKVSGGEAFTANCPEEHDPSEDMSVGQRSLRPIGLFARLWQCSPICPNCREASRIAQSLNGQRHFSGAAAVAETETVAVDVDPAIPPTFPVVGTTQQPHRIASSVVLSRPPLLTRDIPDFEKSFYFYQRRLNDRLALPFTRWFYYKKKSIGETEFKEKQKKIQNKYNAYREGWKDELLLNDYRWKEEDFGYKHLLETTVTGEDATEAEKGEGQVEGEIGGEVKKVMENPLPRVTEADLKNDTKSLDRKMSRTLYLVVKRRRKDNAWKFPQTDLRGDENLKEAAQRVLEESCGVNMNTWFVGNVPIGHYIYKYPIGYKDSEGDYIGKKVFFIKARILAGQANIENNTRDLEDFQWLTKEEINDVCGREYFRNVKNMLVSQ